MGWAFIFYWRDALAGWRMGKCRRNFKYLVKRFRTLTVRYRGDNDWAVWVPIREEPHD